MLKGLLLFLIGVMVGANLVYFVMTRERMAANPAPSVLARPLVATRPTQAPAAASGGEFAASPPRPPAPAGVATYTPRPVAPASVVAPGRLAMPLPALRPEQLQDTYAQTRGSERQHEALDILAAAGTPVLAVADGHIEKLFTSVQGGLTIYQFEPTGRYAYYYAHLQGYAAGLAEGQQVRRGEVIGYVGSTGNANPAAPHLHFAVFALGPERQWWKGTPLNPYPLLGGRTPPLANHSQG